MRKSGDAPGMNGTQLIAAERLYVFPTATGKVSKKSDVPSMKSDAPSRVM